MPFVHEAIVLDPGLNPLPSISLTTAKELVERGLATRRRDYPYTIVLNDSTGVADVGGTGASGGTVSAPTRPPIPTRPPVTINPLAANGLSIDRNQVISFNPVIPVITPTPTPTHRPVTINPLLANGLSIDPNQVLSLTLNASSVSYMTPVASGFSAEVNNIAAAITNLDRRVSGIPEGTSPSVAMHQPVRLTPASNRLGLTINQDQVIDFTPPVATPLHAPVTINPAAANGLSIDAGQVISFNPPVATPAIAPITINPAAANGLSIDENQVISFNPPVTPTHDPVTVDDDGGGLLSIVGQALSFNRSALPSIPSNLFRREPGYINELDLDFRPADAQLGVLYETFNGATVTNLPPGTTDSSQVRWAYIDLGDSGSSLVRLLWRIGEDKSLGHWQRVRASNAWGDWVEFGGGGNEIVVSADADNVITTGADGGAFLGLRDAMGMPISEEVEPWHMVGDPGEPAYQSSWRASGAARSGYSAVKFRRIGKIVEIQGLTAGGSADSKDSGARVFSLPVGYRPSKRLVHFGVAGNGLARFDIEANGTVRVAQFLAGGDNSFVGLDCVFGID